MIVKHSLHDWNNDNGIILINYAVSKNMVMSAVQDSWEKVHIKKHKHLENMTWKNLKNDKNIMDIYKTVTNFLEKRDESVEEQLEESWKVIKTSIIESAEKIFQFTQKNDSMIITRK